MADSVEEKVKGIIVEQLGVQADEVKPEASFVDEILGYVARHGEDIVALTRSADDVLAFARRRRDAALTTA